MALQVRSRLFTRRDFPNLVTVIAHGFPHSGLTTQAKAHGISNDPGKSATKPDRASVFVETLFERGWPDGDEALLDVLSNVEEDRWENPSWPAARDSVWKILSGKGDLVVNDDGVWRLRSDVRDTQNEAEPTSVAPNGPNPAWSLSAPLSNEGSASVTPEPSPQPPATPDGPPRVFVVQGRDQHAAGQVRHFLRGVGLLLLRWEDVKRECSISPTTFEIVRKGLEMAQIIVVVLSGDDEARLHPRFWEADDGPHEKNPTPQPRQNVLLEAGMALGMARNRTVMVRTTQLREISDLSGIHWVTMKGTPPARRDFANELTKALRAAGVSEPLKHAPEMYDEEALGAFNSSAQHQRAV